MIRLMIKFWPVLIPLLLYVVWLGVARRRARLRGEVAPKLLDGPWMWTLIAMIGIGIVMFVLLGLSHARQDGDYVPPHMENGVLVPGHVGP